MPTPRVAIVAALRREVWPLVKHWPVRRRQSGGRQFAFYEQGETVVVCGGMGAEHARRATQAVIELYRPALIISAGFAGALRTDLQVGRVLIPGIVIDAQDASRTVIESGEGVLVSSSSVADVHQKANLAQAYAAHAVDMEAAAVARGAEANGLPFMACKAISDASDFSLPPTERFVTRDGQFQTAKFACYAALRPSLWKSVRQLARDSKLAATRLCERLRQMSETSANEIRTETSAPVAEAASSVKL